MEQPLHAGDQERAAKKKQQASELKKAEKRKAEVDRIFIRIYEDWSAERIGKDNFNMLSEKFQGEQKELNEKSVSFVKQWRMPHRLPQMPKSG